jgi:hypothetical protein
MVDLSNSENVQIFSKSKQYLEKFHLNNIIMIMNIVVSFFLAEQSDNVEHQDYLGNFDRPKTSVKRTINAAPQFDDDAADLLPD